MRLELLVALPIVFTVAAVVCDIAGYKSFVQRKGYSPNLPLWGAGFLFGLSGSFLYLMGYSAEKLLDPSFLTSAVSWPKLWLLLVPAALLALAVWAVARICDIR